MATNGKSIGGLKPYTMTLCLEMAGVRYRFDRDSLELVYILLFRKDPVCEVEHRNIGARSAQPWRSTGISSCDHYHIHYIYAAQ